MKKTAIIIAAMLCAMSCVYPYVAETGESDGRLVVEGDIILGAVSDFKLTYMYSVDGTPSSDSPRGSVTVEDASGKEYTGKLSSTVVNAGGSACFSVNLTQADLNAEYRLHIRLNDGREYVSTWASAQDPGGIDKLVCTPSDDRKSASITMDFHTGGNAKYYRYAYEETWEYTAIHNASYHYIPAYQTGDPEKNPYGLVARYAGPNNFYCWKTDVHKGINLIDMGEIDGDQFKDYRLKDISCNDEKISNCYSIEASIFPISEDSFRYFQHVREGSTYNGDLFAPNPSEMRGNVRNVSDNTELVIGFVDVTRKVSKRIYVLSKELGIYVAPHVVTNTIEVADSAKWAMLYATGFDCYGAMMGITYWDEKRCIDCTLKGGTKNKPAGWPTNHI